jgi:hypothetical protein
MLLAAGFWQLALLLGFSAVADQPNLQTTRIYTIRLLIDNEQKFKKEGNISGVFKI